MALKPRLALLTALFAFLWSAHAALAQTVSLKGRAVDTQGRPVAQQEVVLHRVSGREGARVGADTTDSRGGFTISANETVDTGAVYFAAARADGKLYVGPFVHLPVDAASPYTLVVGGTPVSFDTPLPDAGTGAAGATAATASAPASSPAPLIAALLTIAAVIALLRLARSGRPPARRRDLIRLAVLDEEAAEAALSSEQRRERDRITERLLSD